MKEDFSKILKNNNLKVTKNRLAILKELNKKDSPATAENIYNSILKKDEKYSISSVYRALNQFCEKNIAKKTVEINGTTYFQLNKGHVHSLICEKCKKIIPINHCPVSVLIDEIEEKTQFLVTNHHLEIKGICKKCQKNIDKENLEKIKSQRNKQDNINHKCKNKNCI